MALATALLAPGAAFGQAALPDVLVPLTPPPTAETGQLTVQARDLWFVELNSPPKVEGTSALVLQQERDSFRTAAAAAGVPVQERLSFENLFNGFSVRVPAAQAGKLAQLPGVKAVYPVSKVAAPPTTQLPSPELASSLAMIGADTAHSELGLTGAGVRVGVIDTGIDYRHPDLGGCFGPGCRVAMGWDFVGDAFDGANTPRPDPDPEDCFGHGTHVAGIIGANGGVTGVAPGVTFGAYRIFGCGGSTTDDLIVAALERALADGMQVVNMSLGADFGWPQSPTAAASDRLVKQGVVVVAAAGNSAADGIYAVSAPAAGQDVIAVASYDNTHVSFKKFTVSPDGTGIGYDPAAGAPAPPVAGSMALARTGTTKTANDACTALPANSLAGKVALIRRGTCTFYTKATNAQKAGAAGVVIYNNVSGRIGGITAAPGAGQPPVSIPVVAISDTEGALIDRRLAGGSVTMTWTSQLALFPNPTGGLVSSFSSYGLAPDLSLKPDIGAPGGFIRSTWPLDKGGYATLSGTSMATPHVAGAVALLLQAHPQTRAQDVRGMLQNSAVPQVWWGNPALGALDNVHRQGAGMLRIDSTVTATTHVEPAKLSLGDSQAGPFTTRLHVSNDGGEDVTYDLSHAPALATLPNSFSPAFTTGFATVAFGSSSVTVPAHSHMDVDVTITANPALANRSLYGGYLVITPRGGGHAVRVPYAGFKGDYQAVQVLTPTPFGFPWLAHAIRGVLVKLPNGGRFTLAGDDQPIFLVHLDHESRRLRLEAFDTAGHFEGRVDDEQFLPRSTTSTEVFSFAWDGTTLGGKQQPGGGQPVPNGQHVLKLSVLKALGDENNPADWETWTSPVITVARP